jgi:hypothetical protein
MAGKKALPLMVWMGKLLTRAQLARLLGRISILMI